MCRRAPNVRSSSTIAVPPSAQPSGRLPCKKGRKGSNPAKKQNLPSSRKRVLSHIKHDEAGWKIGGSDSAQVPQPDLSELGKLSISFGHFAPGCLPRPSCALLLLLLSHLIFCRGDRLGRQRPHALAASDQVKKRLKSSTTVSLPAMMPRTSGTFRTSKFPQLQARCSSKTQSLSRV